MESGAYYSNLLLCLVGVTVAIQEHADFCYGTLQWWNGPCNDENFTAAISDRHYHLYLFNHLCNLPQGCVCVLCLFMCACVHVFSFVLFS